MGIRRLIDTDMPMFYDVDAATGGETVAAPAIDSKMQAQRQDNPLQEALERWIARKMEPVKANCGTLRKALDAYERQALLDAQAQGHTRIYEVLGMEDLGPTVDTEVTEAAQRNLLDALLAVQEMVDPIPAVVHDLPEPQTATLPVQPTYTERELEAARTAREFLRENQDIDTEMHCTRLAHVLQALVAECRHHMEQVSRTDPAYGHLVSFLRRLGGIRGDQSVDVFIKGLAQHHTDDWLRVARRAREALAKYDQDSETGIQAPPSRKGGPVKSDRDSSPVQTMDLPRLLMAQAVGRTPILFGGLVVPEKIKAIKDRTGLNVDWMESEKGAPKDASLGVGRIRKDKVSCVVILEGLVSHNVWRDIADACVAKEIPYAHGGMGGIGSILQCFSDFEPKI